MKNQNSFIKLSLILASSFLFSNNSFAIDLDETTRTVPLDSTGSTVILTPEQVKRGKRLFNASCGQCHVGGVTKTNPNLGLQIVKTLTENELSGELKFIRLTQGTAVKINLVIPQK